MAVTLKPSLRIVANETGAGDLGIPAKKHVFQVLLSHATGTADNQSDLVWSDQRSAAASADTIDLAGTLTDAFGSTVTMVELTYLAIWNESTTTTETLTVGAGSNPLTTIWGTSGDQAVIGPNGVLILSSPVDGYTVTAGTGDILTIDPGAATITYSILIAGRSA